ncbi:glycosyltransferase family 2 protein [Lactococcus sp. NH2-7C]|uniref:glycosyltransferase family 2 protein n=1 Tax=Lactococcus sp. NH2-7C TaxID=2879149 RepID=UPI00351D3043
MGIVILNYKVFKDTIDCISSIQAQSYQNFEIVIVDNVSNNGSFEYLADKYKYFSNIHLIKSRDNIGFAQGNNLGIKFLKRKKVFLIY